MTDPTLTAYLERIGPFPDRTVSLIGLGPGDSGLLTVRGALRLRQADVVVHTYTGSRPAVWRLLNPQVEEIHVGPTDQRPRPTPEDIARAVKPHVQAGRRVVIVKRGDPFLFARAEHELRALAAAGIRFEIIPAATAGFAAAAHAGIPLADFGEYDALSLIIAGGDRKPPATQPDVAALVSFGPVAVYLAHDDLDGACRQLIEQGVPSDTPATLVSRATWPDQTVVTATLETIADDHRAQCAPAPRMLFLGAGVKPDPDFGWFGRRPLAGQRILITRPWHQSAAMAGRLAMFGADVIEAPTVAVEPLADYEQVDTALRGLADYDWLILTSANGVDAVADRLRHLQLDARHLASVRIAAIGPATADRLRALFIEPDLVPDEFVAESLAEAMGSAGVQGLRCLALRSDIARQTLRDLLIEAGAECDDLPAYRTTMPASLPAHVVDDLANGRIHCATFTSSSTFNNLVCLLGDQAAAILPNLKLASIGPITSATIRKAGYEPTVEAPAYTADALADAIAVHPR